MEKSDIFSGGYGRIGVYIGLKYAYVYHALSKKNYGFIK